MKDKHFIIMLLFYFTIISLWNFITPPFEAPDEDGHYNYVRFVYHNWKIPIQKKEHLDVPEEGFQPPLYYFLTAAYLKFIGIKPKEINLKLNPKFGWEQGQDKLRYLHKKNFYLHLNLARFISLLIGTLTFITIFRMSLLLFNSRYYQLMFLSLSIFIPQFTYMHGILNNDVLIIFFSTLFIYVLITCASSSSLLRSFYLGIIIGFGFLSKNSIIFLFPVGIGFLVWKYFKKSLRHIAVYLLGIFIIAGWYWIRNFIVYHDFTGIKSQIITTSHEIYGNIILRKIFIHLPLNTFKSFFGSFGYVSLDLPTFVYIITFLFIFISFIATLIYIKREKPSEIFYIHLFSVCSIILFYVFYNNCAHGRLLFPAISSFSFLFVKGWKYLREKGEIGHYLLWAGVVSSGVSVILMLLYPFYYVLLNSLVKKWYITAVHPNPLYIYFSKLDKSIYSIIIFFLLFAFFSFFFRFIKFKRRYNDFIWLPGTINIIVILFILIRYHLWNF